MAAKKSTWIGGTALLAATMMAGTWLLAVQPTLARADETREQAEMSEAQNEALRAKIVQLQADFEKLPQYKADLAELRVGLPTSIELSPYLRRLDAAAVSAGITLTAVEPGAPEIVPGGTTSAPATAETSGATDEASADTSATDATAEPAAPVATSTGAMEGFTAVPVKFTVVGTFPAALAFLANVQAGDERLLLVTNLVGTGQGDAEASDGRPATAEGDIEMSVGGYLYVLTDPTQTPGATADDSSTGGALPQGDVSGRVGSGN